MHPTWALGWTAFVVALIVAPLSHASDDNCQFSTNAEKALRLQHRVVELEKKLTDTRGPAVVAQLRSLDSKLKKHEEPDCESEKFHLCGFHTNQCVHRLLVCDGVKDCENGFDELNCEFPLHEGSTFVGEVVYDHCTLRQPKYLQLTITKVVKREYSGPVVEATMSVDHSTTKKFAGAVFAIRGTYDFASHELYFVAPEKDRLGFNVHLEGMNTEKFFGYIGSIAHDDECAKFAFQSL